MGILERENHWPAATWLVVGERVSRFRFLWSLKRCLLSRLRSVGNVLKCETLAVLMIYRHFPKSVCTVIQSNSRYECLLLKPDYDAISIWEISYPTTIDGKEFFQKVGFLYNKRMILFFFFFFKEFPIFKKRNLFFPLGLKMRPGRKLKLENEEKGDENVSCYFFYCSEKIV